MARQRVAQQVNQFISGINTEASPLSFPANASIDESNMEFNKDGGRSRRLGFDLEESYVENTVPITKDTEKTLGKSQFRWVNAGGTPDAEFLVVQVGNYLAIHDANIAPISSNIVFSHTFDEDTYNLNFDYDVVDGTLVIVNGQKEITTIEYLEDGTFTLSQQTLLIRDIFGVAADFNGIDLTAPQNLSLRPLTLSENHTYNLRNQTFAIPRVDDANNTVLQDPIEEFRVNAVVEVTSAPDFADAISDTEFDPVDFYNDWFIDTPVGTFSHSFPSNADSVIPFLYADATATSDRLVERFYGATMFKTLPTNTRAPRGHFIIDALERGSSRLEQIAKLGVRYNELVYDVTTLPTDKTPGGPTTIAQYAGRIWYAGFSGQVIDGDSKSPRMSSYVLFSQLVQDPSGISRCYQQADPTDNIDSDLVDTDGGFIKLDGAYNIKALKVTGTSLFVFAENGVWQIIGLENDLFTATSYSVSKISNEGCISGPSVVVSVNSIAYWGDKGLYGVQQNQTGTWQVVNLTQDTIQSFYRLLSQEKKVNSVGYYDIENTSIRWLFHDNLSSVEESEELILNLRFSAFTKNKVSLSGTNRGFIGATQNQLASGDIVSTVFVDGEVLTAGGEDVVIPKTRISRETTESYYLVLTDYSDSIKYTFGGYNREDTTDDWTRTGSPVDTPAYLLTGYVTGGDARLSKSVPYLSVYLEEDDLSSDKPTSSCLISAQWNWSQNTDTGYWTKEREAYRTARLNNPGGLVSSKNKIRGSGRSVALRFQSAPSKTMTLYGWEFNLDANAEE